jgi:hypothetical protein
MIGAIKGFSGAMRDRLNLGSISGSQGLWKPGRPSCVVEVGV